MTEHLAETNSEVSGAAAERVNARRIPNFLNSTEDACWTPTPHWFAERTWWYTYSTNQVYPQNTRNTQAESKPVLNGNSSGPLHDLTTYQNINSTGESYVYTAYGVDTPWPGLNSAFCWNGTGILNVLGLELAHLAWGYDSNGVDYLVTFLGPFPGVADYPNELDILSQSKNGPTNETVEAIKSALISLNDPIMPPDLVNSLSKIHMDNGRDDLPPVAAGIDVIQNVGPSLLG
jgi:hypothetical protein